MKTSRVTLLASAFVFAVGCSSSGSDAPVEGTDSATPGDAGSDSATTDGATDGGTDSALADSASADSTSTDSAASDTATTETASDTPVACSDAGTLPPPAAPHAHIDGTFSAASSDYNGSSAAFTGSDLPGASAAGVSGGFLGIGDSNGAVDATRRNISLTLSTSAPTTCATFTVDGKTNFIDYAEKISGVYWRCSGGSVTIDSVSGKTFWFHFQGTGCAPTSIPGNSAKGTVTVTGNGVATLS